MICRRYGTTMRNSVFKLFKDVIESFKITHLTRIKESDMSITLPNGSEIIFVGLDNEEKLLYTVKKMRNTLMIYRKN